MLFSSSDSFHLSIHHFLQFKEEGTTCSYIAKQLTTSCVCAQVPSGFAMYGNVYERSWGGTYSNEANLQLNFVYTNTL